jgi:uncharacterized membrane protein SpoIIM required for sporulation
MKKYIIFSIFIWLFGLCLGLFAIDSIYINQSYSDTQYIFNIAREQTFKSILLNNIKVISILHFGFISAGVITFGTLVFNGLFVGCVYQVAVNKLSIRDIISVSLPHSIELIAIIYSGAIGFKQTTHMIKSFRKDNFQILNVVNNNIIHIFYSFLIVLIAAFAESKISMNL